MTEQEQIKEAFEDLLKSLRKETSKENRQKIKEAFEFANEAHKGVKRRSGEPYILHPLAVAKIAVKEIGLGTTSVISALLHDVEKRSATVVESDGRITARGHARKGEYTVRTLLYRDLPTPFAIREKIASLVRFHGLPLWLMEKTDPVRKIAEVAFRLDTSQLRMLAEADIRGRICQDREELLESIKREGIVLYEKI